MSEESFIQHGVENKQLKEENKKWNENENDNDNDHENGNENDNDNENEKIKKNKTVKDSNIQKVIEDPKEIKSPNWIGKNKFKKFLAIIDSNKFN